MSQSSILFGGLFLGFIVYVTLKGQLPAYEQVLWGQVSNSTATAGSSVQSSQQAQQTASSVNSVFGSAIGSNQPATASNIITGQSGDQIGTTLTSIWNNMKSFNTWVENQGWGN